MELWQRLLPPAVLLERSNLWWGSTLSLSADAAVVSSDSLSWLWMLFANANFIGLNYLLVALPATRIILSERDDQLAAGIQAACQLASSSLPLSSSYSPGRVVAVLGFFHVNGVARRLSSSTVTLEESNG